MKHRKQTTSLFILVPRVAALSVYIGSQLSSQSPLIVFVCVGQVSKRSARWSQV